jgi:hypothetical protein
MQLAAFLRNFVLGWPPLWSAQACSTFRNQQAASLETAGDVSLDVPAIRLHHVSTTKVESG